MTRANQIMLTTALFLVMVFAGCALLVDSVFGQGSGAARSAIVVETDTNIASPPAIPHVFAELCQQGASASGTGGAAAVVAPEPVCQQIRIAELMYQARQRMLSLCDRTPPSRYCSQASADDFQARYLNALAEADRIVQQTKYTGQAARYAYDVLPVGALIWLLLLL